MRNRLVRRDMAGTCGGLAALRMRGACPVCAVWRIGCMPSRARRCGRQAANGNSV
ncbi:MAG TPA: hypothetical protein DEV75_02340 [Desulfovibrio sp.]|nr:hypothetical protein [Desulfovibrio sp.]